MSDTLLLRADPDNVARVDNLRRQFFAGQVAGGGGRTRVPMLYAGFGDYASSDGGSGYFRPLPIALPDGHTAWGCQLGDGRRLAVFVSRNHGRNAVSPVRILSYGERADLGPVTRELLGSLS